VIEDDERLRATVRRILVTRGYEVLEACGGDEAFAISRVDSSPLDLILSDIVIPGCSGPEIVSRVRSQSGDVAVVFMSGYTDHAVLQSCLLQPGTHFIQKPFAPDTLAAKIREVLDAR
jgi:two-component system cell cycle sensor histidine kinase/response regulator CckA